MCDGIFWTSDHRGISAYLDRGMFRKSRPLLFLGMADGSIEVDLVCVSI